VVFGVSVEVFRVFFDLGTELVLLDIPDIVALTTVPVDFIAFRDIKSRSQGLSWRNSFYMVPVKSQMVLWIIRFTFSKVLYKVMVPRLSIRISLLGFFYF
jgi:hypothetical protein